MEEFKTEMTNTAAGKKRRVVEEVLSVPTAAAQQSLPEHSEAAFSFGPPSIEETEKWLEKSRSNSHVDSKVEATSSSFVDKSADEDDFSLSS